MTTLRIRLDIHKTIWISSNARIHHMERAKRTRQIRQHARAAALAIARQAGHARRLPIWASQNPCHVRIRISNPTRQKFDPANASPAAKAILDGITDAGLWTDDDHRVVKAVTFMAGPGLAPKDHHTVDIEIGPWTEGKDAE